MRRDQHPFKADPQRLFERGTLFQLRLHAGEKRGDVFVANRPPKCPAGKVAENSLGIGQRLLRNDLPAAAITRDGRLLQVAQ